jgi:hypothetical protein
VYTLHTGWFESLSGYEVKEMTDEKSLLIYFHIQLWPGRSILQDRFNLHSMFNQLFNTESLRTMVRILAVVILLFVVVNLLAK